MYVDGRRFGSFHYQQCQLQLVVERLRSSCFILSCYVVAVFVACPALPLNWVPIEPWTSVIFWKFIRAITYICYAILRALSAMERNGMMMSSSYVVVECTAGTYTVSTVQYGMIHKTLLHLYIIQQSIEEQIDVLLKKWSCIVVQIPLEIRFLNDLDKNGMAKPF